jgi:FkbM family methyltransferase
MNFSTLPSDTLLGKFLRYPLRLLPTELVVPVLRGPLRGSKWIVGSSLHGWWLGSFEHKKQTRIASALKPGSIFYDIGANAGFYSLLAASLVSPGKVYAFEPLPRNVSYLRRHLELNEIGNVDVLDLAVSDRTGTAFFQEGENGLMGRLTQKGNIRVRTATLDSLLLEERISPPSVVKMDIEGAELRALRGASQCIQRNHPVIFLATHGREVHAGCCKLLESWKYECQLLGGAAVEDRGEVIARFHC